MSRGGRNETTEDSRMRGMEQYKYSSGRTDSGPAMNQKPAYDKPKVGSKNPKSARKP